MMLAIADPPYLGLAEMLYGHKQTAPFRGSINELHKADRHPQAHLWDDPETHRDMVERLVEGYDGWAIAMLPRSLRHYLQWVPSDTRIAVWHDPRVMPTGSHPRRRWEPVLVHVPRGRRRVADIEPRATVGDVLTQTHPSGSFAGAKPRQWTRWVLDMLGYDPEHDTVTDVFSGSGAVTAEINQGVLL